MSGCTGIQDCVDEKCNSIHTELTGMEAWARWSWCYDDLTHPKDFAGGFRAGYQDILNGGAGCQPTLPPKNYWKSCYRTPEGHCRINAWFEGFSHGALAAQQDGADSYGHIPLSPTAQGNFENAMQENVEYDWSTSQAPPSPSGSVLPQMDTGTEYSAPRAMDVMPGGSVPLDTVPAPPVRSYEDIKPILGGGLETTSGRMSLPNLGG